MKYFTLIILIIIGSLFMNEITAQQTVDWQGHRGCRGLMPENTVPAFMKAIDLGVTTLELDVVITKDKKVLVSHEPWMSHIICTQPDGAPILEDESSKYNIYQMTLEEVQQFDCGMRSHPNFPDQQKMAVHKPSLEEAVIAVKKYCFERNITPPRYNIELKSYSSGYNIFMPEPPEFVALVVKKLSSLNSIQYSTLQSFDVNVLEELNKMEDRNFQISYLVEGIKGLKKSLKKLSFKPDVYSPHYKLVKKKTARKLHVQGILLIPWTINDSPTMQKMIDRGVDGIITDYPNLMIR